MASEAQIIAQQLGLAPERSGIAKYFFGTWKFMREYPLGGLGAIMVLILIAMAAVPSLFTLEDPNVQVLRERYDGLSSTHWFGQDQLGRDQYARIVYGARTSIIIGFGVVIVTDGLGLLMGTVSGYLGGWWDKGLQRIVDIGIALPFLPVAILVVTALTQVPTFPRLVLAIAPLISFSTTRIIRSGVLSLREQPFVDAARSIGASDARIMFRHIMPNVFPLAIVSASTLVGIAVLIESSLSFLGYGVQPPTPSWGRALSDAREFMVRAPHLAIFPGLAIFFTVFSFNMLGDAVRDKIDPRMRGSR